MSSAMSEARSDARSFHHRKSGQRENNEGRFKPHNFDRNGKKPISILNPPSGINRHKSGCFNQLSQFAYR